MIDKFADIKILRYHVDGFEKLPLDRKMLLYHLSEAALYGRDMYWDQNCQHCLKLRKLLEAIYVHQKNTGSPDPRLALYTKRVWFANCPYHHYSNDKFQPGFTPEELCQWAAQAGADNLLNDDLLRLIFDDKYKPKKVSLDTSGDIIRDSAVNFYSGYISQKEVEEFYRQPNTHPLNSQVYKCPDGSLTELVWQSGRTYSKSIEKIMLHLNKARQYACNEVQGKAISLLIDYYVSGSPGTFDEFNKVWVTDKDSDVDFINGFIEVYNDPMGLKGSWESIVELADAQATKQIELIAANAQWFEDHSPVDPQYRKTQVRGVSMKVIDAVMLGGDCYPSTPIGVNLPNADWIRERFGSKSISLANITHAHHDEAQQKDPSQPSVLTEFAFSPQEQERARKYGRQSDDLHTRRMDTIQAKYRALYALMGGDEEGAPNITVPEIRLPMMSLLRRQIMKLSGLVSNAEDYTISR
ncbi:dipeptidyl peptidase 3, partial [Salmonella enterica]|nr:dipeptidyl peptidase 3 [Salmonella enterica]